MTLFTAVTDGTLPGHHELAAIYVIRKWSFLTSEQAVSLPRLRYSRRYSLRCRRLFEATTLLPVFRVPSATSPVWAF